MTPISPENHPKKSRCSLQGHHAVEDWLAKWWALRQPGDTAEHLGDELISKGCVRCGVLTCTAIYFLALDCTEHSLQKVVHQLVKTSSVFAKAKSTQCTLG